MRQQPAVEAIERIRLDDGVAQLGEEVNERAEAHWLLHFIDQPKPPRVHGVQCLVLPLPFVNEPLKSSKQSAVPRHEALHGVAYDGERSLVSLCFLCHALVPPLGLAGWVFMALFHHHLSCGAAALRDVHVLQGRTPGARTRPAVVVLKQPPETPAARHVEALVAVQGQGFRRSHGVAVAIAMEWLGKAAAAAAATVMAAILVGILNPSADVDGALFRNKLDRHDLKRGELVWDDTGDLVAVHELQLTEDREVGHDSCG
mmetsp:Transcript_16357/g.30886  ORF Transcript_16357/g.30886 Transcript_16357/m.30886 type:complete len:259 (+) Transcript_16357:457-1233(+)|eukprot:CAMPEP_0167788416 /NCGR_PEP_ID=MMETSP0111_2-20121227/10028_1 /TAXON_ID=91324 /ORGANISM="Lotharella globosa, Strain CCCM811" /LENGTH=258 /DNA_ID=CAMNT_0007680291 /DNA_START=382 /DNA_END=1161 /DNA_ORIENTATION=+